MNSVIKWLTTVILSLQQVMTSCLSIERYEIVVYQQEETRASSLSCLFCFNGDRTEDCISLKNISNIPTQTCMQNEPYCKVRRLSKDDNLVTFDRYCASHCEPGCTVAALYTVCVSCCQNRSLCNVDNAGTSHQWRERCLCLILQIILVYMFVMS